MGFIRGVIAGVAMAAGAAAWYMSRAGSEFRQRYRIDRKLGQIGDEIEVRTRDVRSRVNDQVADARSRSTGSTGSTSSAIADKLDDVEAKAAEEAAEMAADVEAKAARAKRSAKSTENG